VYVCAFVKQIILCIYEFNLKFTNVGKCSSTERSNKFMISVSVLTAEYE
jgi:hypothetical protein